jgi:hypothetical protein
MKYRKKPVVIESVQFKDDEYDTLVAIGSLGLKPILQYNPLRLEIDTLEGVKTASIGDYIIKGVNGEFYPCKPNIFEKTYDFINSNNMNFGLAIEALKKGCKVARNGWNGKGMYVYYVPANSYASITDAAKKEFGDVVPYNAYLAIKNVNGTVSTWVPSINDCLSEDWNIVE